MIPAQMPHEAERTKTKAEHRANLEMDKFASAFAKRGSALIGPFRALRRLSQHSHSELTTGQTVPPAGKGQLLSRVNLFAARSSLHSFPRWCTFD
jgi:hypothetical protein